MAIKFGQDVCYRCDAEVDGLQLIDVCGNRIWVCDECYAAAARLVVGFIEAGRESKQSTGGQDGQSNGD
jgi:hypothetical protein